jgi:putative ABC transport system permease protein
MNLLSFQFLSTVRLGVKSLMLHKLRSFLTMLGIIFGVCSVIAMLAIGEGASYEAQEAIKKLGSDNIILRSVKPPEDLKSGSVGRGQAIEYGLTYHDGSRIQSTIPGVKRVLPVRIIARTHVSAPTAFPARFSARCPFILRSSG